MFRSESRFVHFYIDSLRTVKHPVKTTQRLNFKEPKYGTMYIVNIYYLGNLKPVTNMEHLLLFLSST